MKTRPRLARDLERWLGAAALAAAAVALVVPLWP